MGSCGSSSQAYSPTAVPNNYYKSNGNKQIKQNTRRDDYKYNKQNTTLSHIDDPRYNKQNRFNKSNRVSPPQSTYNEKYKQRPVQQTTTKTSPKQKCCLSPKKKPVKQKKATTRHELSKYQIPNYQWPFINDAIIEHNKLRNKHHAPELTLNHDLTRMAVDYAKACADKNQLVPSNFSYKSEILGENLLMFADANLKTYSGISATQEWYQEGSAYPYEGKQKKSMRHFTQLIWKNSKEVGFGVAKAKNGSFFCVALYFPPGNIEGEFNENVLKP